MNWKLSYGNIQGLVTLLLGGSFLIGFADLATVEAVPPPWSEKKLTEKSDVVGVFRVLGVACTQVNKHKPEVLRGGKRGEKKGTPIILGSYQAWLQAVRLEKGDLRAEQTLLVCWQEFPPVLGPECVPYFPGEVVRTHLQWNEKKHVYESTFWNAKGKPEKEPTGELPAKTPGAIVFAQEVAGRKEHGSFPKKGIHLDQSADEEQVSIAPGQRIHLTLPSNRTTGFQWKISQLDQSVLTLVDQKYQAKQHANNQLGSGGKTIFLFRGKKSGSTTLKIHYSRPWQGGEKEQRSFHLEVTVDSLSHRKAEKGS